MCTLVESLYRESNTFEVRLGSFPGTKGTKQERATTIYELASNVLQNRRGVQQCRISCRRVNGSMPPGPVVWKSCSLKRLLAYHKCGHGGPGEE